jgi:hypothetical protein
MKIPGDKHHYITYDEKNVCRCLAYVLKHFTKVIYAYKGKLVLLLVHTPTLFQNLPN